MNIYLPIISNIIIVLILIAGIFIGRKNGWRLELSKSLILIGSLVGIYFLNPLISTKLMEFDFCQKIISLSSEITFKSLCLFAEFALIYVLVSIAFLIIRKNCRKIKALRVERINTAKSIKSRKERRKESKQFKKLHTKQISKSSKTVGAILGLVLAFIVGYIIMSPIKYFTKDLVSMKPELEYVETAYDYTIYDQIDKLIGFDLIK